MSNRRKFVRLITFLTGACGFRAFAAEKDAPKITYGAALDKARVAYKALGITKEMEFAVIEHLVDLGVLETCYVKGSKECKGPCPSGQSCVETTTHNCVCKKDS